jgi:hypothetical protein
MRLSLVCISPVGISSILRAPVEQAVPAITKWKCRNSLEGVSATEETPQGGDQER